MPQIEQQYKLKDEDRHKAPWTPSFLSFSYYCASTILRLVDFQ